MKRILVPTDFSNVSNNAAKFAAQFCRDTKNEMILLHVVEGTSVHQAVNITGEVDEDMQTDYEKAEKHMDNLKENLKSSYGVEAKGVIKHSALGKLNTLIHKIDSGSFDLIIMGTQGASNISKFYLGSHSYRVAKKIKPPVMLIPDACIYQKPEKVVYATDYKDEDVAALKQIIDLLQSFDTKIRVVHISEKDTKISQLVYKSISDLMEDDLEDDDISFDRIVSEEKVASAIDLFMIENDQDVLVLLSKDYNLVERLFHRSISKEISQGFIYPFFIM